MAGYSIKGYQGFLTYDEYLKFRGEDDMGDISSIMNGQLNNEEANNNVNEAKENKVMGKDFNSMVNDVNLAVDDVKHGGELLEGQGLIDVFGREAEIDKVDKQYKKGTTAAEGKYNIVVSFKPKADGKKYFTFLSGSAKQKIDMLIESAEGVSALNNLIEENGLWACFGSRVFESTDAEGKVHTNVKIWFETR